MQDPLSIRVAGQGVCARRFRVRAGWSAAVSKRTFRCVGASHVAVPTLCRSRPAGELLFVLARKVTTQRRRCTTSVALKRRMSRCQGCAGLARQASHFLARQESNQRRRPGFTALRFTQGALRCSICRAAAQLASLREAQTVLADFPRQLCAARRLAREVSVRSVSAKTTRPWPPWHWPPWHPGSA